MSGNSVPRWGDMLRQAERGWGVGGGGETGARLMKGEEMPTEDACQPCQQDQTIMYM